MKNDSSLVARKSRLERAHRVYRLAANILAMVGGLYLVIVYSPLPNLLAMPLLRIASNPTKADVIVILSGGRYHDGSLNEAALSRTIAGVRLYMRGLAPRLLFSGGPCCGQSASVLMADLAMDLGVPRSAVLLEERSNRTHDSAINSAAILRTSGMKTAILVTSPLHMLRARLAFQAAGVSVYPVRASEKNLWLVSNAAERISLFQEAVHEYLGLAVYRIQGWI